MTAEFTINGQTFTALNGGPLFKFNESVSFQVFCETQEEIDSYWSKLTEGGTEVECGWLKDKYGLSWQIVTTVLSRLLSAHLRAGRVTDALLKMKKFDIKTLLNA